MAKPQDTFGTLKRIFSYMHGFRIQFIFVVIAILISSSSAVKIILRKTQRRRL